MSTDQHASVLAALSGSTVPVPPQEVTAGELPEAPEAVAAVPAGTTSAHSRAVAAVLTGAPALLDAGAERADRARTTAGVLVALVAAGRRVRWAPSAASERAVREQLGALGATGLLDGGTPTEDAPAAPHRPEDEARWRALLAAARERADVTATRPAPDVPSPREALAELLGLRATHPDPPLVPEAATWNAVRRDDVARLLSAPAPEAPAGPSPEQRAARERAADALAVLAEQVGLLTSELGWRTGPVAALDAAVELQRRVGRTADGYAPGALAVDVAAARAVLDAPQRTSFFGRLSGDERARRREAERIGALRRDGGFSTADLDRVEQLQGDWARQASGPPRTWAGTEELASRLAAARAAVLDLPADAGVERPDLAVLPATGIDAAVDALRVDAPAAPAAPSLEEVVGVPAAALLRTAAGDGDAAAAVRAVHLRALAEPLLTGAADDDAEAEELARLDGARGRAAVDAVREGLAAGRLHPVLVAAGGASPAESVDVVVVDDVHERGAADVAALTGTATQLVAVGTGGTAGAAWARLAAVLVPQATTWPVREDAPGALREEVAEALRAAGLQVRVGVRVGAQPVDLLVTPGAPREDGAPQASVVVDLGDIGLPTIRDRDVVLPALLAAAGAGSHRLPAARWWRDADEAVARVRRALEQQPTPAAQPSPAPRPEPSPEPRPAPTPAPEPAPEPTPAPPAPAAALPKGLGDAAAAQAVVDAFTTALAGAHPNVDQTPVAAVDAAVALAWGRLGTGAADAAVLDAAMESLTFRRRGVKVLRAFKDSLQRSKKRMRGAGVKIT